MEHILTNVKQLEKKAEVFLDDKVIARNMVDEAGRACSLGYVLPGEFDVTVEESETVEVLGGDFSIQLPGDDYYSKFNPGETFYIPENASYKLVVNDYFDYYCIYSL